jgi:cyclophilin family peptidyl-prolyl cis-trans isomerase
VANPTVTVTTSVGTIRAEVYADTMPATAENFLRLVGDGFFDGQHIHRVIDGFVVQMGCPHSRDPASPLVGNGEAPWGAIRDEFPKRHKLSNEPGTLAMANGGPDSGSSQFFVNLAHNKRLDWFRWFGRAGRHPVFGRVVDGMSLVEHIGRSPTDDLDRPINPVKIEGIAVDP